MQDVGIPCILHSDDTEERKQSEPYSPWKVRTELCNREWKKAVHYTLYL